MNPTNPEALSNPGSQHWAWVRRDSQKPGFFKNMLKMAETGFFEWVHFGFVPYIVRVHVGSSGFANEPNEPKVSTQQKTGL